MKAKESVRTSPPVQWLNRTVLGIGMASLLSDWSHEIASAVLPAYLANFGAAAAWLGIIEGVSDGFSSIAKMASGYYTDQLRHRKPIAVVGYVITALATAAIGWTAQAWQVLLFRTTAWLGRGVRTPVRKALLAGAVPPEAYGRAFGFERMMDTLGAIIGPISATALLFLFWHNIRAVFAATLLPGLFAAVVIALWVEEKRRAPVPHVSFGDKLASLPHAFRRFLVAVGIFGAGDFAHTMLILLATQKLSTRYGATKAAALAVALYVLHNVLYAAFAFVAGWFGDRYDKRRLLSGTYAIAGLVGLLLVFAPLKLPVLALVFALAGVFVAAEEALEDALAAELVQSQHHGMAFGLLATVNGIGDFVSSAMVGMLWSITRPEIAFAYSTVLFFSGSLLILRAKPVSGSTSVR